MWAGLAPESSFNATEHRAKRKTALRPHDTVPFMTSFFILLSLSLAFSAPTPLALKIKSEGQAIVAEQVLQTKDVIWGFDFLPTGQIVFSERGGRMVLFDPQTESQTPLSGVPTVAAEGQGGLLDVVVHPEFKTNSLLYFTYAIKQDGKYTTRLGRAQLKGQALTGLEVLFTAQPAGSQAMHFGSRLAFDHKGHVFLGVGERNERERAQNLSTHSGKVIRLMEDGKVPKDNPFVGKADSLPEIWSYGHRNPQGIYYDLTTQELWLSEHGPRGGDELNLILRGKNYGWPVVTFGREYYGPKIGEGTSKPGIENPIKSYVPSIAPSSLTRYTGAHFKKWQGDFFTGALVLEHLNRLVVTGKTVVKEERLLEDWGQRIRAVRQSPEGYLYLATDSGKLIRLKSSSPAP